MKRDEQFEKNLDAAHAFLLDLIEHPDRLDAIEDGATIVHVPADDPELRRANEAMVAEMAAGGATVRQVRPRRRVKHRAEPA